MKFSICIPTLNEENYISIILSCLEKQTFKEFEVIVSDGNSDDNTKEEALKFSNKFPILFLNSPKRGISFQRNYAAKHSKNDSIIFFDADVKIENTFLESVSKYLEKKDVDTLSSWVKPISNNIFDKIMFFLYNVFMLEVIKNKNPGAGGAFIYVKKGAFDKIGGFREDINYSEDFDLIKRLHDKGFSFALLRSPKIWISMRRFDKEGRIPVIIKILKPAFYFLIYRKDYIDRVQGKVWHKFGDF